MNLRLALYIILSVVWMLSQAEAYGEESIINQYDANGSLVSGDGKFYKYNDANQLVKVCEDAACAKTVAEYFYDHSGQRVKKIENGVTTYYIGKHYATQVVNGQTQNTSYYFANGERVAKKDATGTYFYHPDHLGGVSVVTNATGLVVSSTSYLPFGEVRQGGTENYYTGKENDKGAGLYNFEARYVSPELRHFTQADVEEPDLDDPQDLNLYAYAGNNPLSYVDLDGYKKKKKAKLSKREKWMIAHGVDPDHDKTPLKKAKKLFKEGKKYQVASNSKKQMNKADKLKIGTDTPMLTDVKTSTPVNVKGKLTPDEKNKLIQQQMEMLAQAAYYSELAKGYERTSNLVISYTAGAIAGLATGGLAPGWMAFSQTIASGGISIWDAHSDSILSNASSDIDSIIGYGQAAINIIKWLP